MPLPVFFIGLAAAAATSVIGGKKTIDAVVDSSTAEKINKNANKNVENARVELDRQRKETGESIEHLGELKLNVLDHDVLDFVNTFEMIKNIDFQSSSSAFLRMILTPVKTEYEM